MAPVRVSVAGSTGSIGTQTLEVVAEAPDRFRIVALSAQSSVETLAQQAHVLMPEVVAIGDGKLARALQDAVPRGVEVVVGPDGLVAAALAGDTVVNGVVGFAGLDVTLATLGAGKRLALANKESLVAGGPVVAAARQAGGGELVPVDSEHCAVHQCLRSGQRSEVARVVLTASGGPFRGRTRAQLADVDIADALAHPTWNMGPKITVDSSTLMNKGLEVIEAVELFGLDASQVAVVVHPQSIVHSMVDFTDGATIAQLSAPDMRLCIGYALGHPDRLLAPYGAVDLADVGRLEFEAPDLDTFPCLGLAHAAAAAGGSAPAWLNAANEVAVEAFLAGAIGWLEIAEVVAEALDAHQSVELRDRGDVVEVDRRAREVAGATVSRRRNR